MQDLQHNVVNILYTIKGMIEAHQSKADEHCFKCRDEALEHAQTVMGRIYDQSNRALEITRRIRLAMKVQDDPKEVLPDVSLNEVWEEAVELLQSRNPLNSLEVISHIPNEFPLLKCRRLDLLEVFYTFLMNAAEAMSRNGKIIVRANLQFHPEGQPLAVISVSDTGPGIPEEILGRLFEPFFTTKSMDQGNGLGLCIVKSLVRKNRGTITVSSFKGCGTTFTLAFAVSAAGASQEQSCSSPTLV